MLILIHISTFCSNAIQTEVLQYDTIEEYSYLFLSFSQFTIWPVGGGGLLTQILMPSPNLSKTQSQWWGGWVVEGYPTFDAEFKSAY